MNSVAVEDGALAVISGGEGPLVVFVHGTPSSAREFEGVMALLVEHRSLAVEHLGFGRSSKPAGADYSLVAHQRRFAASMAALDVTDAVFVLHDFGASIAFPWLVDNPERVRGLVLSNTFLWPATGPITWVLRFYSTPFGRWLYRVLNVSLRLLLPWSWGSVRPLTRELHARYLEPFPRPRDRHALSALPGELVGETLAGLAGRASELGQWPVRAVWGMADPAVGPVELQKWREALPGLAVDEVAGAGHFVADEAPERVAAAVKQLSGAA